MKHTKIYICFLLITVMMITFCIPAFALDSRSVKMRQLATVIENETILSSIENDGVEDSLVSVANLSRVEDDLVEFSEVTLLNTRNVDGIIENDYVKESAVYVTPRAQGQLSDDAQDGAYSVHLYLTLYYTQQISNNCTYYSITKASGSYTKANEPGTVVSSQSSTLIQNGLKISGGTTTTQRRTTTLSTSSTSWTDTPPSSWAATGLELANVGCEYKMTLKRVSTGYTWTVSLPVFVVRT